MERNLVKDESDYIKYLESKFEFPLFRKLVHHQDVDFYIDVDILLLESFLNQNIKAINNNENTNSVIRDNLVKTHKSKKINFSFNNCEFYGNFMLLHPENCSFTFENCTFHQFFGMSNNTFEGKFRFYDCTFNGTGFNNTTFSDLADFYNCYFKQKVIFHKTDFKGTTVFSASTFEKNVLFTYSLIEKLIIFRGTKFEEGLDLSCAILAGEMNPFDIHLGDFGPEVIEDEDFKGLEAKYDSYEKKYEKKYSDWITQEGKIPIKNQRETYRILKEAFVKREDVASSIKYKVLEKETLRKELEYRQYTPTGLFKKNTNRDKRIFNIEKGFEKFNLWLNKWSNNHGKSYSRSLAFILAIGAIVFYFSAIASNKYHFACDTEFYKGLGDFAQFLLPTHDIEYLGPKANQPPVFFVFDFIGRLIVGYGIYQFIQAFRKYR